MKYKQLDFRKRCQIYGLLRSGYNQSQLQKKSGYTNQQLAVRSTEI